MATDPDAVEQAVSRTLRDNLERIQRTSDELHRAVNDLVSACASSRPSNALPPMVRAQASAASLSAVLDVLSRFVTAALQPGMRSSAEQEMLRVVSVAPQMPAPQVSFAPVNVPLEDAPKAAHTPVEMPPERAVETHTPVNIHVEEPAAQAPEAAPEIPLQVLSQIAPEFAGESLGVASNEEMGEVLEAAAPPVMENPSVSEPEPSRFEDASISVNEVEAGHAVELADEPPETAPQEQEVAVAFNVAALPIDQQELHRRAYRVAKVSMQDIKMLRPDDVRLGREHKDLCFRLRDDIEKAHKEYERRFQPILSHPVDYFYDWMVEVLGGGNAEALGEYPYPSAVLHH